MPRFSDSNIESDAIIGKGIDLEELFDRRIVIEKIKIEPTKFPGKNASGMRMQMQVVINAEFMDTPDSDGDFFKKDANGKAIGTRRSVFTGSDNLMSEMKQVQSQWKTERVSQGLPAVDFVVFDTTIAKVGKMFHFTWFYDYDIKHSFNNSSYLGKIHDDRIRCVFRHHQADIPVHLCVYACGAC